VTRNYFLSESCCVSSVGLSLWGVVLSVSCQFTRINQDQVTLGPTVSRLVLFLPVPLCNRWPDLTFLWMTITFFFMWGALSMEDNGL
jgi:hypothetical protein